MDLQIVKFDLLDKIVLIKSGLCVTFEFLDRRVQPERLSKVKFVAHLFECPEYFVCPGVFRVIAITVSRII